MSTPLCDQTSHADAQPSRRTKECSYKRTVAAYLVGKTQDRILHSAKNETIPLRRIAWARREQGLLLLQQPTGARETRSFTVEFPHNEGELQPQTVQGHPTPYPCTRGNQQPPKCEITPIPWCNPRCFRYMLRVRATIFLQKVCDHRVDKIFHRRLDYCCVHGHCFGTAPVQYACAGVKKCLSAGVVLALKNTKKSTAVFCTSSIEEHYQ